jgi:hypothetical protein
MDASYPEKGNPASNPPQDNGRIATASSLPGGRGSLHAGAVRILPKRFVLIRRKQYSNRKERL